MKKVFVFIGLTFFITNLFSQVSYRVEYDKPSDKFTYKKIEYTSSGEKKEINLKGKLPKLNQGDNVVIEVTNYNPFLYHVVIEEQEMEVVTGKTSNAFGFLSMLSGGLVPLSTMMSGLNQQQKDLRSGSVAKNESELELFTSESQVVAELIKEYERKYTIYQKTLLEIEKEDLQSDVKSIVGKLKDIYKNYSDPIDKIELLSSSSRLHFFKAGVTDSKLKENANSFDYQLMKFKELLANPTNSYTKKGIEDWIIKLESANFQLKKSFMVSSVANSFTIGSSEQEMKRNVLVGMNYKIKFFRLKDIMEAVDESNYLQNEIPSPKYLKYYYSNKFWNHEGEVVDTMCENCVPILQAEGLWNEGDDEIPRNYLQLFKSGEDKDKEMKDNAVGKWTFYSKEGEISSVSYGPEVELNSRNKKSTNIDFDEEKLSSMYSVVKSVEIPVKSGIIMNWSSGLYSISSFKQRSNYYTVYNLSMDTSTVQQTTVSRSKICIGSQMAFDFAGNKLITPTLNLGAAVDFWDDRDIHFIVGGGLKFKKFPFMSLTAGVAFTQVNVLNKALQVGQSYDSYYDLLDESTFQTKKYVPGYFVGLNINL
jgi:hypothetical protein